MYSVYGSHFPRWPPVTSTSGGHTALWYLPWCSRVVVCDQEDATEVKEDQSLPKVRRGVAAPLLDSL